MPAPAAGQVGEYRQRWKVETVMSVSKRKFGEGLSARRDETQHLQALLRGVVYNLYRLALFFSWLLVGRHPRRHYDAAV